ncbi:DUF1684 domain-containing protein [Stygiobacter electus]|uniref:DUF1684 domain-containing protein n=1 Tax=Stygiobacter electus TaxID=3032292 RepID=A0AAE3P008_9BACT|nr:DUF1684 domain-containing protein [Stygiobacter electus]MDF1611879.1 DUF1684 domain-containing protein [Stygiobacter electus]
MKINLIAYLLITVFLISCEKNYTPEEKFYISSIEQERKEKNEWMKNDPDSPFNLKSKVEFHDLNYFDVDPKFVFSSKLYFYDKKDTITIFGTKGEPRNVLRIGYLKINYEGKDYKVNVYESQTINGNIYHSIWFTDLTTNNETYGVGRYLDFELNEDPNYIYKVDFNLAYNPYCAYSAEYSCAIPTKEDYIPIKILAGEKKFHD